MMRTGQRSLVFSAAAAFLLVVSVSAGAAPPAPGDLLVLTNAYDGRAHPYLFRVDPVTAAKTLLVDFSTFTDPPIFGAGGPLVPGGVAAGADGSIWAFYGNSFGNGSVCNACGGAVLRIAPDGTHSLIVPGAGLYPAGLAIAADGNAAMVTNSSTKAGLFRVKVGAGASLEVVPFVLNDSPVDPDCDPTRTICPPIQFGQAWSLALDPATGAIIVGDVEGGQRVTATGTECQQIPDCGAVFVVVPGSEFVDTNPVSSFFGQRIVSARKVLFSDFGNAAQGPIAEDAGGTVALAGDGSVLATDSSSGSPYGVVFRAHPGGGRELLTAFGNAAQGQSGGLPTLSTQLAIAVLPSGGILIGNCDGGNGPGSRDAICAVDANGLRTLWSDFGVTVNIGGVNRQLLGAYAMAIVPPASVPLIAPGTIVAVEPGGGNTGRVYAVDPVSGTRRLITDFADPASNTLGLTGAPYGVAVGGDGTIYTTDHHNRLVWSVDPATGERRVLSDFADPTDGPTGNRPFGIVVDTDGDLLVIDKGECSLCGGGALFKISAHGHARTKILDIGRTPTGVALGQSGEIYVVDEDGGSDCHGIGGCGALYRVDRAGTFVTVANLGVGTILGEDPEDLALDRDGTLLIADSAFGYPACTINCGALLRFNPATSARAVVAVGSTNEVRLGADQTIFTTCLPAGSFVLSVCAVDRATGRFAVISDFENAAQGPVASLAAGVYRMAIVPQITAPVPVDQADLDVQLTASPSSPIVDSDVMLVARVHNNGPQPATNVKVRLTLPASLSFVSSNVGVAYDAATGLWTLGPLANGDTAVLTVTATITAGSATVTAQTAGADQVDPSAANNTASVTLNAITSGADLAVAISAAPTAPPVGSIVTLTASLQNNGPDAATTVVARVALPADLVFVSATGPYDPATGLWTAGTLPRGASRTIQITATIGATPPPIVVQTVSADQLDPIGGNNSATVTLLPPGIYVDGTCSLRAAIVAANTNAAFGGCPAGQPGLDTIFLPPNSTQQYVDAYEDAGQGPSALPAVTSQIIIEGRGSTVGRDRLLGPPAFRIFYVSPLGNLVLRDMTIRDGDAGTNDGGGILALSALRLERCRVIFNAARIGGGVAVESGATALFSDSVISGNQTPNGGGGGIGGLAVTITVLNTTIGTGLVNGVSYAGNVGAAPLFDTFGGGIYLVQSTLIMTGGSIGGNRASFAGGLELFESTATLTGVTVAGNHADQSSGGVTVDGRPGVPAKLTMVGGAIVGNSAAVNGGGILSVGQFATLDLRNAAIAANAAGGDGGGLHVGGPALLTNTTIGGANAADGNSAANAGGGIAVHDAGYLVMNGGTLANNRASGAVATGGGGGAIANGSGTPSLVAGTVELTGVALTNNSSPGFGNGGAISNYGRLTATSSVFTGNHATASGGALGNGTSLTPTGWTTLTDVVMSGNSADAYGGAVFNRARLDVTGGRMATNRSAASGGAVMNRGGVVTFVNAILDGNTAAQSGGNLYNEPTAGGSATFDAGTVSNGIAPAGGGIASGATLTIRNGTVISDNQATGIDGGGGLWITGEQSVDISNATIRTNHASAGGVGGALRVDGAANVRLSSSTLMGNDAPSGSAIWVDGFAAASSSIIIASTTVSGAHGDWSIAFYGPKATGAVTNSTISGNAGMPLVVYLGASVAISSSTIVANTGGGVTTDAGPSVVSLVNTIVAGNHLADGTTVDCSGSAITSIGYNLFGLFGRCALAATDKFVDGASLFTSVLAPLADNGGPTQTHALLPGSPAIDAGNPLTFGPFVCDAADQRGQPRPQDGDGNGTAVCDIGAFEQQTPLPSPVPSFGFFIGSLNPGSAAARGPAVTIDVFGSHFVAGSVVTVDGAPRPTVFVGPTDLRVSIPASDLAIPSDYSTVQIGVTNPGGLTSDTFPLFIIGPSVEIAGSALLLEGTSVGLGGVQSLTAGALIVTAATNNTAGSSTMTVNMAVYRSNPTLTTLFNAGAFFDLQVIGADSTDSVTANFYYPTSIVGAAETNLQLHYWTGAAWALVKSSGGAAPIKDTTDNLDGRGVSGGRFTVTFDNTSTPKITELTGTVFAVAPVVPVTTTEASLQFDPTTKDLVLRPAGPGDVSVTRVPAQWGDGDGPDEHEAGPAELRTYRVTQNGQTLLTVVVKVKRAGHELEARVLSIQYGADAPRQAAPNMLAIDWSLQKDGSVGELTQKATLGAGRDAQEVSAKFSDKKGQTVIDVHGPDRKIAASGLVPLQLSTLNGTLRIAW
jgi:uncharacterized repeat protein (TIGR01451 family)